MLPFAKKKGSMTTTHATLLNISHVSRNGPLTHSLHFKDTKDPCPVYDGRVWHLYGSGGRKNYETWHMLHATAQTLEGPWIEQEPSLLPGAVYGASLAAPGVVFDFETSLFHMFIQTDCFALHGRIEHRVSTDGHTFILRDTILESIEETQEAGIYDPHPAIIHGQKFLVYSGMPTIGRPDIYLAKSATNTWDGPWLRMGEILNHSQVEHHNQHDHADYEWGLEGAQLLELPNGQVLLNAVCFLPDGVRGTRQRVFFALSDKPEGPYRSLGPILLPSGADWESAENGHAAVVLEGRDLHLFYQARSLTTPWRFGHAVLQLNHR